MLKIGITGGIGSGKSTVAAIFEVLGIPVYYSDNASKRLMSDNEELKSSIIHHFGAEAYANDVLNRKYLAKQVFNDDEKNQTAEFFSPPGYHKRCGRLDADANRALCYKSRQRLFLKAVPMNILIMLLACKRPKIFEFKRAIDRDGITTKRGGSKNEQADG